ncbi:glycosyltransferase family 9 protein [Ideonella paludis]|uniref:Glycosyltransferase family 9 protein n=1 Tax=Ideonella paludis TaxID=1233411 RepID=A0ABS5DVK5_9BURK|nr:glycosyltransferase family 9 protein [Ideonella paludis]MBQ0935178.1 glycosyltransferase family 9 protein [Ideonella paludis]
MNRPLVIRLCNYIGDVVLSLPALQLLAAHGYEPHLYGAGWASTLLTGTGWAVTKRGQGLRARVGQLRSLRQQLRAAGAPQDEAVWALAMPNSFSSALELRLGGFAVAGFASDGRGFLLKKALPAADGPHAAESFWAQACGLLGQRLPIPDRISLPLTAAAQDRAREVIARHAGPQGDYVCIAPFAGGLVDKQPKRWPEFAAFAKRLEGLGLPILVCPGPAAEVEEARRLYPGAILIDKLPLDAYAALLGQSKLVVANDTGPAHLAAASAAPLLSVLGPTKTRQWRPWGPTVTALGGDGQWPDTELVWQTAQAIVNRP